MVEGSDDEDTTSSEQRRQPELARVVEAHEQPPNEFEIYLIDDSEDDVARTSRMTRTMQGVARQVSLDPNDSMEL
jgi:type IV secretion system protein VirD4